MNRGGDSILSVYSDARAEYTKQLCIFLVPAYFQFFIDLLERSKHEMSNEPKRILWQFQNYLNDIHDWNMEKVSQEINRIHTNCGCDYLDDLLTAVFIAHTKVLTAIRIGQPHKKVEINIPKVDHFLFKVLCETAKLLWGSTYLFRDSVPSVEKQQNYRAIEGMLNEGVLQAVRTLIPVKSILKDFVNQDSPKTEAEEDSDDEDKDRDKDSESDKKQEMPAMSTAVPPLGPLEPAVPPMIPLSDPLPSLPSPPSLAPPLSLTPAPPQMIILDDKPSVRFGQFDAVFDSDHPSDSDMIYDPKDSDTEEGAPDLEIMEENGISLSEGIDFDSLDTGSSLMESDDYEEL